MKKFFNLIILLFCVNVMSFANEIPVSENYEKANQLYQKGEYQEAIKLYESELQNGFSSDLYYNIGNAYYKINEIAKAILYYERALKLEPAMSDAKHNLDLANTKIIDRIDVQPEFFLRKWTNRLLDVFTSNEWFLFSLLCLVISLTLFLVFIFARTKQKRKIYFISSIVLLMFFIYGIYGSAIQKRHFLNKGEAIIMQGLVVVKRSPDETGTVIFQLHEGTKVNVKSQLGEWTEITLDNGAIGWLKEKSIVRI